MSSRAKVIAGTALVAVLAAGGAAFAAVELTTTSHTVTASPVTAPFGDGVGSYGLGGGRLGGRGFGGGLGPGPGDGGPGFGFRRFFGGGMTAAAVYLALSASELQSDLQNGQTLAQIAKSQGKSADGLVAAMASQARKALAAAVSKGLITQAQANQFASRIAARMRDMANGVQPQRGAGGPGAGSFGGANA